MTEVGMTAQQFTECLDNMLITSDTSLFTGYPEALVADDVVCVMAFAFHNAAAKYDWRKEGKSLKTDFLQNFREYAKSGFHRLCYQLSSVIGSLGPSVVFGYRDILLTSGIFLACETQSVKLQQVLCVITAQISLIFSNQENATFDLVSVAIVFREEKERHQKNLYENEQLKKQIAEMEDRGTKINHKL
ncbi:hypothetical protein RRG08_031233 [Elysia crispata]|uniref:Uncharacterized protein n=1 Tax=Elysia crispata TaxID=231223 RepID=A0AAE1AKX9_9GAST|nr:hypothetical protein RRG08_031233 [Elysia crispata]